MTGRLEIPACIVYGDDLVLRKCDEYDYYDLADDLAQYGVRLQPATKDGHEVADVGLESATFLKRHFTPQTFGCVANMEIKDIVPSLFWFRNTETISDTCNSALREIALYGHKTFTDWRRSIACACEDAGVPTEHLLTWNEIITLMQVMVTGLPLYGDMQDAFEIRWKQVLTSRKTCLPMGLGVAPPPQDELDKLSSSRAPEAAYAATLREHLSGRDSCVRVIVTSTSNSLPNQQPWKLRIHTKRNNGRRRRLGCCSRVDQDREPRQLRARLGADNCQQHECDDVEHRLYQR